MVRPQMMEPSLYESLKFPEVKVDGFTPAAGMIKIINGILDEIIDDNLDQFRDSGSFEVETDYGGFSLDTVDGSYDMSLDLLIHRILYEEGMYKRILTDKQYGELEESMIYEPDCLYRPSEDEDDNYCWLQYEVLDPVFEQCGRHVGKRLLEAGFDVKDAFSEYL